MAFQLWHLLGPTDLVNPTWDEIAACVEQGSSFVLEGDREGALGSFSVDAAGQVSLVQVESPGDRDQYVLIDPAQPSSLTKFVSAAGDEYRYPAFCLIDRELLRVALRHFVETGQRQPTLGWMPVAELLKDYEVFP